MREAMSGSRTLIVNADDLGRSPGINRGVIEAHRSGIVTSTTLMVNTPWAKDGATQAVSHPGLGIGLHLNYCYGNPISDPTVIASLVTSDGAFETDTEKLIGNAVEDHIKRESIAQITEFRRLVGRDPSHLDSHRYLHSSEPFASAIVAVAADFGLAVRALDAGEKGRLRDAGVRDYGPLRRTLSRARWSRNRIAALDRANPGTPSRCDGIDVSSGIR